MIGQANETDVLYLMIGMSVQSGQTPVDATAWQIMFYIPEDSDQWKYPKLLLLAQASHKSLTTYANQFISLVMMGQYASGIRIRIQFM